MEWFFILIILIFSVIIHEISHGAVADALGDSTAKDAGRLTLNPIKHIDLVGSIIVPLFLVLAAQVAGGGIIFGWAKPVPINPYNFRDQKYGSAKVALAGPAANLALAVFFALLLRFVPQDYVLPQLLSIFSYIIYINILLAVFNLFPIPPLDGSHILFTFLPQSANSLKIFLSQFGLFILLFIIFFVPGFLSLIIDKLFYLLVGFPIT